MAKGNEIPALTASEYLIIGHFAATPAHLFDWPCPRQGEGFKLAILGLLQVGPDGSYEPTAVGQLAMELARELLAERVEALRSESAVAGDSAQVALCDRAADDERAFIACVRALADAEAR